MKKRNPLQYTTVVKEDYLYVVITGDYLMFEFKKIYSDVLEVVLEKNLSKILFDAEEVKGNIITLERYQMAEFAAYEALKFRERGLLKLAIAIYGKIPPIDPYRFGEIVARAFGLNLKVTTKIEEAIKFLNSN
jgi:hypothetical protein